MLLLALGIAELMMSRASGSGTLFWLPAETLILNDSFISPTSPVLTFTYRTHHGDVVPPTPLT